MSEDNFPELDIPRGFASKLKRFTNVSTSAVSIFSRLIGEGYLGMNTDKSSHAESLKGKLGDLKGPMMKAAQLMASIPGALPEEYSRELMELQSNAPPMGWLFVKRRMAQELGSNWQEKFKDFSHDAVAAASLGQVHKATTHDGASIACKLQYPDMTSTIGDDLGQLKLMLSIYERMSGALNTEDLFDELKERLLEELDYKQEKKNIQYYQLALKDIDGVHIPNVVEDLSTKRLLTMSWLEGKSVLNFKTKPQDEKNELARKIFNIWYAPFYNFGMIHGDPHLGNYTIRPDLSVNLLDYGCIRLFPSHFIKGVVDLYKSFLNDDKELAVHAYESWGFTKLTKEIIEILNIWAGFLYEPLIQDKVRPIQMAEDAKYGREMAAKVHAELSKAGGVKPPKEFVMMDRAAIGMGAVFMHLNAELNWHQEYESLIENFSTNTIDHNQQILRNI